MSARVHLHARYGKPDDMRCLTVCGVPCDAEPVAYRDLNPDDVTCAACVAGLPNDRPAS